MRKNRLENFITKLTGKHLSRSHLCCRFSTLLKRNSGINALLRIFRYFCEWFFYGTLVAGSITCSRTCSKYGRYQKKINSIFWPIICLFFQGSIHESKKDHLFSTYAKFSPILPLNPLEPGVAFLFFKGYRKATPGCNGLMGSEMLVFRKILRTY